ncbi:MAG: hypothetical protein B7C24_12525 [Bacteroidetes bacterium 4572_77]|nr:MAG: hypothetical protein B7C24_12525 [Bacteroidetes bacterium 4572_77]
MKNKFNTYNKATFFALLILPLLIPESLFAQEQRKTIHQIESEYFQNQQLDLNLIPETNVNSQLLESSVSNYEVYGYYPYWVGSYENYDWTALTTIGYFSYEVDSETGGYTSIHGFDQSGIVEYAHERDVKVELCITCFGNAANRSILGDTVKQNTLIHTAVALVKDAGADGINLDFESVPSDQRDNLTAFITKMRAHLSNEVPNSRLTICLYAVDWNSVFDVEAIVPHLDKLLIMGYDYYYSGSSYAGPVAPLEAQNYYLAKSVDYYLDEGAPKNKLVLLLPWYGRRWTVLSEEKQSETAGRSKSMSYATAKALVGNNTPELDAQFATKWFNTTINDTLWQAWYDDTETLETKYLYIKNKGIAGVGFWALGYQGSGNEMWETVKKVFSEECSIEEQLSAGDINLSPNPIAKNEILNIKFNFDMKNFRIEIYDINGKLIGRYQHENIAIDESFSSGTYILLVKSNGRIIARKRFTIE